MREGRTRAELSILIGIMTFVSMLVAGNSVAPSFGQKTVFETPFESSTVPACSNEEVAISGIARFTFVERVDKAGNSIQRAIMKYSTVDAVGLTSGTEYKVKELEQQIIQQDEGDNKFTSMIRGIFKGAGSAPDTYVRINLVTLVNENGDVDTLVDDVNVRCK